MSPFRPAGFDPDDPMTCLDAIGDHLVMHLGSSLAGLHDNLARAGLTEVADLIGDLVEVVDGYLFR